MNVASIVISIIALVLSCIGVFRNEIFPFNLKVYSRDVVAPVTDKPQLNNVPIALRMLFVNEGYGNGIIDHIILLVTGEKDKSTKIYRPTDEIDIAEFVNSGKTIEAYMGKHFTPFLISGKSSIVKDILFGQEIDNEKYPLTNLQLDKYTLEIYIKFANNKKYKLYATIPFEFTKETRDKFLTSYTPVNFGRLKFIK